MRKISFIAALVVAMTAVSCVKEMQTETPVPEVNGAVTFEASFGAATKAVLEPGATESKVAWEAGDEVGVFAGEDNYLYKAKNAGYTTTLSTEAADVPAEGPYYAVYPYDADAVLAEGVITTTLPAVQTAVLGSFTTHLSVAQAVENKFAFKNVCGLVGVKVDAENITKIVLEGNNGEIVAGAINVTVADAPTWTVVAEQGATTVTLDPAEGTLAKGVYYFAVLPQTFEKGFNVKAYKGDDAYVLRNVAAKYELKRSDIVGSKAFGIEGEGTEASPYILVTPQDMVDMRSLAKLGGETWFKMANDIDLKGINWVPVNYDQNFERKIHFDGGNNTISNLSCEDKAFGGSYASLFGVLYGTCKNLKVDNATIVGSSSAVGVIAGYMGTDGKPGYLENVTITKGSVTSEVYRLGGVAGISREGTFKNVSYQGNVTFTGTGGARIGGFVGQTMEDITCENCTADAVVSAEGSNVSGGFVGYVNSGTLTLKECTAGGSLTGKDSSGGMIGEVNASAAVKASDSSSAVTVNASNYSAGFLGKCYGTAEMTDCSTSGDVTLASSTSAFLGWLAHGSSATLDGCSASGKLKGNNNVGGIVGLVEDGAAGTFSMTDCHYTGEEISAAGTVGGLIGYVNGQWTISESSVETDVTATAGNCGGLLGSVVGNDLTGDNPATNNTSLNISDSHYSGTLVAGANYVGGAIGRVNGTVKSLTVSKVYTTGSVKATQYVGGLIGAPMSKGPQSLSDCWSSSDITSELTGTVKVGGFMGVNTTPVTLTRCYATGNVVCTGGTAVGGLVGENDALLTIIGCHATGTVSGKTHVAGLVGSVIKEVKISKSYSTGSVSAAGNRGAGLVANCEAKCTIDNSYSTTSVSNTGQQNAGLVAYVAATAGEVYITNSFATGDIGTGRGSAGILGNSQAAAGKTSVTGCIAWNKNITTNNRSTSNYAPAAVVGSSYNAGTFMNCWRRADMVLTDAAKTSVLTDQADVENGLLPLPTGVTGNPNRSYHGKAAAADATISSVAKAIGWSEDIWDLSGDVPVLK